MKGIIYKWTCNTSGKIYIGQTTNEQKREKDFLTEGSYAGQKIDNARKKYGLEKGIWTKKVLKRLWCKEGNEDEFRKRLNFWERFFIEKYDSFKNGYNMTNGGDCNFSEEVLNEIKHRNKEYWCNLSQEEKDFFIKKSKLHYDKWRSSLTNEEYEKIKNKMIDCHRGHAITRGITSSKKNRGKKLSEEAKKHLSKINEGKICEGRKVLQYSSDKMVLLNVFPNITKAAKSIDVSTSALLRHDKNVYNGFYWEISSPKETKGYSWKKRINRWNSKIKYKGKNYDLGCFEHEEAAHEMYVVAKRKIEEGVFEEWEINQKTNEKIRIYKKYKEKILNSNQQQ